MKNLKGYLNCLTLLIKHITKIFFFVFLFYLNLFAQKNTTQDDSVFVMQKSPWTAVILSVVIPGAGQIYNQSYIKAPIVWGIGISLYIGWKFNNDRYRQYENLYYLNSDITTYKIYRDFYRDQRDLFTIYMGLAYLLNLVDAYVDAQLFDFNVTENNYTQQPMLGLRMKF
jgi:Family of unknown function (DUF5683)